ncbi:hypothetical protein ACOME3_008292 [Neoechinorhynchus agilis]
MGEGMITRRTGPVSYRITNKDGIEERMHGDFVRPRENDGNVKNEPESEMVENETAKAIKDEQQSINEGNDEDNGDVRDHEKDKPTEIILRRSSRIRRPPQRFR